MLEFRTFGTIEVRIRGGDRRTSLHDQPKRLALLAVLSARRPGELVRREQLVSRLWPHSAPSSARSALNTTLSRLRRELGGDVFRDSQTQAVGLSPGNFRSDVGAFVAAARDKRFGRAAELYRGPFLEGFRLPGNRPFEEWLEERRSTYRRQAHRAAVRTGRARRETGDLEAADAAYRRALRIDPLGEEAAAGLIRVLVEAGRRSEALQVYRRFRDRRRDELDLPPSGELRELVEGLRDSGGDGGKSAVGALEAASDDPAGGMTSPADRPAPLDLSLPSTRAGLLAGLLIVAAAALAGRVVPGPDGGASAARTASVAVLPFETSGSADRMWRDGMVTALATGLDGAGGLRAIPDRTILSVWNRGGRSGRGTDIQDALAVAREVGARYAVVGSSLGLPSELRFTARVLRTQNGERIGTVEVRGSPDSAVALTDDLTRRLIGLIEDRTEETVRRADVASLTAGSVDALKSYLEGEKHLRAGRAGSAMQAFRAAIRADSGFALPYARIGLYGLWRHEGTGWAIRRAHELSDQLPERDRRLVRALHMGRIQHRTLAAADSFRRLGREYPDDPSVWSSLGEFVFHAGIPGGLPEIEEAHARAVALDPGHTAYYDHYVGPAFTLHHDSALASRRVEAMPEGEWKRMYRTALDLAFGDDRVRRRALRWMDTARIHEYWLAFGPLESPEELGTLDSVLRTLLRRDDLSDSPYARVLFLYDVLGGRIRRALADHERYGLGRTLASCAFARAATLGYPVPGPIGRKHLSLEALPADAPADRLRCSALYLIEQGRGDRLPSLVSRIRGSVDTAAEGGVSAGHLRAVVDELRGYRAWKEGELERAADLMGRSNEAGAAGALWRGDLHRQLGHTGRAEGWYRAAWRHPLSFERLGRLYERTGDTARAVAAYRRFIAGWAEADEPLRERVSRVRARVAVLGGTP